MRFFDLPKRSRGMGRIQYKKKFAPASGEEHPAFRVTLQMRGLLRLSFIVFVFVAIDTTPEPIIGPKSRILRYQRLFGSQGEIPACLLLFWSP
jgi:hypothetical protein